MEKGPGAAPSGGRQRSSATDRRESRRFGPGCRIVVGDVEMRALADGWGNCVVEGVERPLVRAQRAVQRFTAAVVEREVGRGERLWPGVAH